MSAEQHVTTYTRFAEVAGVNRGTVTKWRRRDDFPVRTEEGWPVRVVRAYGRDRFAEAVKCQTGDNANLKAERLRKQIARLDVQNAIDGERLKRERMETQRRGGELVEKRAVLEDDRRRHRNVRGALESWRQHETAKHPERREVVEGVHNKMLTVIRDAMAE